MRDRQRRLSAARAGEERHPVREIAALAVRHLPVEPTCLSTSEALRARELRGLLRQTLHNLEGS